MKPTKSATTTERISVVGTLALFAVLADAGAAGVVSGWWVESSLTRRDVMDFCVVVHAKGDFRKKKMKCE